MSTLEVSIDWITLNDSESCSLITPPPDAPIQFIMSTYKHISIVLAAANIVANSVCLHIFRQPIWQRSMLSRILLTLSLLEILFHVSVLLGALIEPVKGTSLQTFLLTFFIQKIVQLLNVTLHITRNWNVVFLAAFRYECICRPMATRKLFRDEKCVYRLVIGTFVCALLVSLPRMFESGISVCTYSNVGDGLITQWKAKRTLQMLPLYEYVYISLIMLSLQNGGPILIVSILSGFVLSRIRWRNKFRKANQIGNNATHSSRTETSVRATRGTETHDNGTSSNSHVASRSSGNKLIIILCITFFILEIPAFFSKALHTTLTYLQYYWVVLALAIIGNLLVYFDSVINIFIYMGSNPTFREAAARVFCRTTSHGARINETVVLTSLPTRPLNHVQTRELIPLRKSFSEFGNGDIAC